MTEKLVQPTPALPETFDAWYLPQRPLCCDGAVACEATFIAMQSARGRKGGRENHA